MTEYMSANDKSFFSEVKDPAEREHLASVFLNGSGKRAADFYGFGSSAKSLSPEEAAERRGSHLSKTDSFYRLTSVEDKPEVEHQPEV